MSDESFYIWIRGRKQSLKIGINYLFEFIDPTETSFNMLRAEVMDIYWQDEESGKTFFYIFVHEQNEDYLICDNEIVTARLSDLVVGKFYRFVMDNGSSLTGEYLEQKELSKVTHSFWIDIGRQPDYLDFRNVAEIIELNIGQL